ncbi:MAG: hypothetical protein WD971_00790 [Pirellulales bacterium]
MRNLDLDDTRPNIDLVATGTARRFQIAARFDAEQFRERGRLEHVVSTGVEEAKNLQ